MTLTTTAARNSLASFVGVGRGLWLFPLDTMFRTVGLRYGWLKALFIVTPAPLLRGDRPAARRAGRLAGVAPRPGLPPIPRGVRRRPGRPVPARRSSTTCPRPTRRTTSTATRSSSAASAARCPTRARRSTSRAARPARRTTGSAAAASARSPIATSASSPATRSGPGRSSRINAFSMGAWAAGFNMSLGMMRHGIVKSIGPDVDKILSTLAYLGPSHRFLISGYPPFLKHLLDEGERRGFPWADYELHALVGGEGMTEELRDVLLERFVRSTPATARPTSRSGWPASRRSRSPSAAWPAPDRTSRRALFGSDSRLPMVFQYNPLDPLHGGQRPRRGHLHRVAPRPPRAADPLQRPRRGRDRRLRRPSGASCASTGSTSTDLTGDRGPRPARPAAVGPPDPAAVPLDPRPARRDDQRHGLEHLPRGHRDDPVPRPGGRPAAALVHARRSSTTRRARRGRRSRSS